MTNLTTVLGIETRRIIPALFAYLFHRIDQRQFLAHIVEEGYVDREEAVRIKDCARSNGYVLKNCKLYAWACWSARKLGQPRPKARVFGVDLKDSKLLRRLNLSHLEPKRGFARYPAYSIHEFDHLTTKHLTSASLRNYVGKFVTKKMGFLMKSYGETRHDLETTLKESAVLAWYKQYPRFDSELHMVNVSKTQIHNTGHTLITSLTSKSRQRLMKNDDGSFETVNVDLAVLSDVAAPPQYGAMLADHLQALASVEHKLSTRAKDFLLCCAGQYHAGFSGFLRANNEDAATTWTYDRYMEMCRRYFEATPEEVTKLFSSIRRYAERTYVR